MMTALIAAMDEADKKIAHSIEDVQGLVEDRDFVEATISAILLVDYLKKRARLEEEQEEEPRDDE